ncbi:MAG: outer membrane protein assembly factor BamA [Candidatus Aminicenantes bacterium]|jgi:outer membrane protein insertion porin family
MKKSVLVIFLLCFPLVVFGQQVVERIIIDGNERVTDETIIYYLSSREGDYFNRDLLKRDFRVLWATGFFSNIIIEEEEGTRGKIIKIILEENPVIKDIVYKTGKRLKENDIIDKLKEKDEYVLPYSYYSPYKIQRIKETVKELLVEKGLTSGTVKVQENKKGNNELEIVFDINEGPKVKVGEILFEGRTKLREHTLVRAFKENQKHNLISWISGKDNFKQNKLDEDLANLKKKYQEYGYMEAVIGEPEIEDIQKRNIFFKKRNMKRITIPVSPGYRYSTGEIKIEGNTVISTEALRSFIDLKEGQIYSTKAREEAVEEIREMYMNGGFLFANPVPVENLDPKRKRVNLTFNIIEGELAYLRRLEITGNTYTKDKVIRREMLLREGDPFYFSRFKDSLLRMKQLGLVELEGEPEVKPDPQEPTQIDVNLKVHELQRNNIQFSAGYSGYEGTFVALNYSTVNFLGAGEKFEIMLQHGKRIKNYVLGFSEPYIFDLPLTVGINLHNQDIRMPFLYDRKGKGIDFTFGARIKGYLRTNISYGFEDVHISLPDSGEEREEDFDPVYSMMFGLGNYKISSFTPMIYRSTIDSPLTPSRGTLYLAACKFAGGILGGEIHLIKPRFEWSYYQPIIGNTRLGFHVEYSYIKPTREAEVPFWERFYLGGERSIRGYDIYTIGPRSEQGTNIGGSKSLVMNAEYIIPVSPGGPLFAILFFDAGNAYGLEEKVDINNLFFSTGLEARIFIPALRVPFRLIFAYNNRLIYAADSHFAFRFAIGTTF